MRSQAHTSVAHSSLSSSHVSESTSTSIITHTCTCTFTQSTTIPAPTITIPATTITNKVIKTVTTTVSEAADSATIPAPLHTLSYYSSWRAFAGKERFWVVEAQVTYALWPTVTTDAGGTPTPIYMVIATITKGAGYPESTPWPVALWDELGDGKA